MIYDFKDRREKEKLTPHARRNDPEDRLIRRVRLITWSVVVVVVVLLIVRFM